MEGQELENEIKNLQQQRKARIKKEKDEAKAKKAKQEAEARTNKLKEEIEILKMQERIDQNLFDPKGENIDPLKMHLFRQDLDIYFKFLRSQGLLTIGRNPLLQIIIFLGEGRVGGYHYKGELDDEGLACGLGYIEQINLYGTFYKNLVHGIGEYYHDFILS